MARKHLAKVFGISSVQATKDIALYNELAPENLYYAPSSKRYCLSMKFKPQFISTDPQAYLAHLAASKAGYFSLETSFPADFPPGEIVPIPGRKIKHEVLQQIILAIRDKADMEIRYQSMANPEPIWRWITPHTLNYDGFRWHARSFCHMSKTFKDFLLARILELGETKPSSVDQKDDTDWHKMILVRIGPNPGLSKGAQQIIALDYGMTDGVREMEIRKASLLYFYKNMRFDIPEGQLSPQEQQVILLNREEVENHLPS